MSKIEAATKVESQEQISTSIAVSNSFASIASLLETQPSTLASWVEEVDRQEELSEAKQETAKSVARREEIDSNGFKTVIEEAEVDGQRVINTYKVITKKVPKRIAKRRMWAKFGASLNDGPGPNTGTTYVDEEISLTFLPSSMIESEAMKLDKAKLDAKATAPKSTKFMVKCRYCKSEDHRSPECPYKDQYEALEMADLEIKANEDAMEEGRETKPVKTGVYVPPMRRDGAVPPAPAMSKLDEMRAKQDECTVRVTNVPTDMTEEELREVFSMGRKAIIQRVHLKAMKSFAFVTYDKRSDAEEAIKTLNKHRVHYTVLSVEWSKPKE